MNKIWTISKKELASYFDSLIAYVLIVIFLVITSYVTWLADTNVFFIGQANLSLFFGWSMWTLFFFIPAITMRSISEEKRTGTIELLATKAITDTQIITGKFLSCLMLIVITLLCTLPFYATVSYLGPVDHGAVIGGYLGLILMSSAYISIGILASSLTDNQIVAFLLSLVICFLFQYLFGEIGRSLTGSTGQVFNYLNVGGHYESLYRGVIDSKDIIYFISISFTGLFLARTILSKRNWI